jgi:hypothetical protein
LARASGDSLVMSWPWNWIDPVLGEVKPAMISNRVVFPAPFGPMMPRISPGRTTMSTPLTARMPPNDRLTPLTCRMGGTAAGSATGAVKWPPAERRGVTSTSVMIRSWPSAPPASSISAAAGSTPWARARP